MELFGYTISMLWLIMLTVLWVFIALWPAQMARAKGYSFWLFFLFSLFAWWVMFFVVLFLPNRNTPPVAPA